jgi:hypothetical protein
MHWDCLAGQSELSCPIGNMVADVRSADIQRNPVAAAPGVGRRIATLRRGWPVACSHLSQHKARIGHPHFQSLANHWLNKRRGVQPFSLLAGVGAGMLRGSSSHLKTSGPILTMADTSRQHSLFSDLTCPRFRKCSEKSRDRSLFVTPTPNRPLLLASPVNWTAMI